MFSYTEYPFYPGPVSIHPAVAAVLGRDYGPPRMGLDYVDLYKGTCGMMQKILGTNNEIILPTGEAMLVLWGVLKSCLKPGDGVVSVGTGVFGDGMGDMAASLGCKVEKVSLPYDSTLRAEDMERVDAAIQRVKPVLLTAIHCETPSGTLNPLNDLAILRRDRRVPLFTVDAVASMGGAPVRTDDWGIDVLLGGSQKCLSCPPDMGVAAVSPTAWERMSAVNYAGYEALLPFHGATEDVQRFPYTPHWRGVAGLHASAKAIMEEGLEQVFARHAAVAEQCRAGLAELGVELWTRPDAVNSPTVTAAKVPTGWEWPAWRDALAAKGLVVGGSLGPMAGKVFRLGHMGTQAQPAAMEGALNVMRTVLKKKG